MTTELSEYTWQTLYEYIERRIAGLLHALQFLKDPRLQNVDEAQAHTAGFERQLEMLRSCLPLVSEMQNRENLQDICPVMSLNIIRLQCRHRHDKQDGFLEFAWISPIAEGRYSLKKIGTNESQGSGNLQSIEADLTQIVEEVEQLVKAICIDENQ
jgi:hypothetical protein